MKLELTLSKETISNYFSVSRMMINAKSRISNNVLVVSSELINIWEKYLVSKNLEEQFNQWFYMEAVLSQDYVRKVKIGNSINEQDIMINTCELSNDKIIVADNNVIPGNKRNNLRVIFNRDFNNNKIQRIKVQDIEKVYCRNIYNDIFSLYETPVVIDVSLNSNSKILAEYLSKFYVNTSKLIIRDLYLSNVDNLRNFKKYILPYLDKQNCKIEIQLYWNTSSEKKQMESIFNNMDEYNIKVINTVNEKCMHESFIESDKYKFNIGYRMRLFGDKDDGLTEQDTITITTK